MDVLWAPWRLDYILGPKPDECVFCVPEHTREDERRLILWRGRSAYIIMNRFPYNNGHVMVCPYRHVSCVTELNEAESRDCMDLLKASVAVLKRDLKPQGINAGLNLGEAAGAGIAAHMHFQIVPRWNGDASFMAVFGEARVVPEYLVTTYRRLKPMFAETLSQGA